MRQAELDNASKGGYEARMWPRCSYTQESLAHLTKLDSSVRLLVVEKDLNAQDYEERIVVEARRINQIRIGEVKDTNMLLRCCEDNSLLKRFSRCCIY